MTDRGAAALRQSADALQVGPSAMRWQGDRLVIEIDEVSALPVVSRVRGRITVIPQALTGVELPLTPDGAHVWRPFAPVSRIEVELDRKGWHFEGHGYFDANFGTRSLEEDFSYWTWGRYPTDEGALTFYDADRRDGSALAAAAVFDASGGARMVAAPPKVPMNRSLWAVRRETRGDAGSRARQVKAMLDAPFYSRSVVETTHGGQPLVGVHEALDLNRFRSPVLKPMLAVRVPRRRGWRWHDTAATGQPA